MSPVTRAPPLYYTETRVTWEHSHSASCRVPSDLLPALQTPSDARRAPVNSSTSSARMEQTEQAERMFSELDTGELY